MDVQLTGGERMKLATWNVNSLKVRLPQVLDFLATHRPDALCLQETKSEDANFPLGEIQAAGYGAAFAGQKTYNGVAILSPTAPKDISVGIPNLDDPQKRVIAVTLHDIRVVCVYVPNGETVESDKYLYKLDWRRKTAMSTILGFGRARFSSASPRKPRFETSWRSGSRTVSAYSISRRNLTPGGIIG
jgi:exodeoxyribonuclease III